MGRLENLPESIGASSSHQTTDQVLQTITHDLQNLQQEVVGHLRQDIRQLQAEKSRLMHEIEKLQHQHEAIESQYEVMLTRQQQAQQQAWAKQFAIALANHLQEALSQRLSQTLTPPPPTLDANNPFQFLPSETQVQPQIASLDDALNRTFTTLRNDLNSYQSSLSQQIDRMQNIGQQGEAILQVLVSRISQQLRLEAAHVRGETARPTLDDTFPALPASPQTDLSGFNSPSPAAEPPAAESTFSFKGMSQFQLGLVMILLSTVALSLHNVAVNIMGNPSQIFGAIPVGGFISLKSFGNSLLLLFIRMLVVVPLMTFVLARRLHRPAFQEIKAFCQSPDHRLKASVIGSGFFLFLSQVLIYLAIGQVGPGVAVTILFMYPLITVPLAWVLFGDRPTRLRILVMIAIFGGVMLTTRYAAAANLSWAGVSAAIASGISFAFYLISMQISFRKLHPVPVSLIQFFTIFVLSGFSLIVIGITEPPSNSVGLMLGGFVLGGLTLAGYLLNNFGVRFMGAARASIIAASGPALTALLAVVMIPGARTFLSPAQIIGILIVTLGVVTLSFERLLLQQSKPIRFRRS